MAATYAPPSALAAAAAAASTSNNNRSSSWMRPSTPPVRIPQQQPQPQQQCRPPESRTASGFNNNNNINNTNPPQTPAGTTTSSTDTTPRVMSQSLGTYPHRAFFRRQSTNVSQVSYAGCLHKRSNHPVVHPSDGLSQSSSPPHSSSHISSSSTAAQRGGPPQQQFVLQPQSSTAVAAADAAGDYNNNHDADVSLTDTLHSFAERLATQMLFQQQQQPQHSGSGDGGENEDAEYHSGSGSSFIQHDSSLAPAPAAAAANIQDDNNLRDIETQPQAKKENTTIDPAWHFVCQLLDLPRTTMTLLQPQPQSSSTIPTQPQPRPQQQRLQRSSSGMSSSTPIPVPLTGRKNNNNNVTLPSPRRIHSQSSALLDDTTTSSTSTNSYHTQKKKKKNADDWQAPAPDIVAPDGHVWRARYCILQGGTLYFYRHKADAESTAAVTERSVEEESNSSTNNEYDSSRNSHNNPSVPGGLDLSSSLRANGGGGGGGGGILAQSPRTVPRIVTSSHIWEKRVPVSAVGAVRSAEGEYGPNALELSAIDADNEDCLILKAQSAAEMNEWLFQLHRAIEVWVRNIMTARLDAATALASHNNNSRNNNHGLLLSPRYLQSHHYSPHPAISLSSSRDTDDLPMLSHGHGRNSLHRRKVMEENYYFRQTLDEHDHEDDHDEHEEMEDLVILPSTERKASAGLPFMPTTPDEEVEGGGGHQTPFAGLHPPRWVTPAATGAAYSAEEAAYLADALEMAGESSLHSRPSTPPFRLDDEQEPELSAPPPPEVQRPPVPAKGKYVPPHLRRQQEAAAPPPARKYVPPHLRNKEQYTSSAAAAGAPLSSGASPTAKPAPTGPPFALTLGQRMSREAEIVSTAAFTSSSVVPLVTPPASALASTPPLQSNQYRHSQRHMGPLKLGGCADPEDIKGSIVDSCFIPRKASRLSPVESRPYGEARPTFTIGAVSECGRRSSNEDSYLIVSDLWQAFAAAQQHQQDIQGTGAFATNTTTSLQNYDFLQTPGIFCVFDGHCGNQAARYAAERFTQYLYEASAHHHRWNQNEGTPPVESPNSHVETLIRQALTRLDLDFCQLCVQDGRAWESGATALIAALVDDDLIICNLGDCRGILSRSVDTSKIEQWEQGGWTTLPEESSGSENVDQALSLSSRRRCVWKDVTATHSPSRDDEQARIEQAGGWITTETEIPVSQALRLDLADELARDILNRCFDGQDRAAAPHRIIQISRVCGELAVSRALGDRDFKAAFHPTPSRGNSDDDDHDGVEVNGKERQWEGSAFLPYPENHSRNFTGDLVSNVPEVQALRIGQPGVYDEFMLLACDGLWDVMDADDAVRVTRKLLLEEGWPAQAAAARLAKLAVHLGSSDNITVVIVHFVDRVN